MKKEITISKARGELTALPRRLARNPGAIAVTRRGSPVLAILPWELYESLVETLEILGDEELMTAIRRGIKDIEAGRTYSMEEVKRELDL